MPFSLDKLIDLPRYVGKDTHQTVLDNQSGYDHIPLSEPVERSLGYSRAVGTSPTIRSRLGEKSLHMCTIQLVC